MASGSRVISSLAMFIIRNPSIEIAKCISKSAAKNSKVPYIIKKRKALAKKTINTKNYVVIGSGISNVCTAFLHIFHPLHSSIPLSISLFQLLNKSIHAVNSYASVFGGEFQLLLFTIAFLFFRVHQFETNPNIPSATSSAAFFIDPVMDERLAHLWLNLFLCIFVVVFYHPPSILFTHHRIFVLFFYFFVLLSFCFFTV